MSVGLIRHLNLGSSLLKAASEACRSVSSEEGRTLPEASALREGACCLDRNLRNCNRSTDVGRDSILQKSISLREKQANALYKAPGLFGSTKTTDVLAAIVGGIKELTELRDNRRNLVKLFSSSSILVSNTSRPYVLPARSEAIAAQSTRFFSLIIFAEPAVSYVGSCRTPQFLK